MSRCFPVFTVCTVYFYVDLASPTVRWSGAVSFLTPSFVLSLSDPVACKKVQGKVGKADNIVNDD